MAPQAKAVLRLSARPAAHSAISAGSRQLACAHAIRCTGHASRRPDGHSTTAPLAAPRRLAEAVRSSASAVGAASPAAAPSAAVPSATASSRRAISRDSRRQPTLTAAHTSARPSSEA